MTAARIHNADTPIKILMVEDNRADVVLAQHVIDRIRVAHDMHVVQDGQTALEYLSECLESDCRNLPDLIILDLNLPRANGVEVLRKIRSDDSLKGLNVAVLTTTDSADELSELKNLDVLCCLTKPAHIDDLDQLFSSYYPVRKTNGRNGCNTVVVDAVDTENLNSNSSASKPDSESEDTTEELKLGPRSATVLLIEDSAADAMLISKRLTMEFPDQFQVIHKSTLREGIELLKEIKVDVITLDLGLPDAMGMQAFEKVKLLSEDTPIVVLTGVDDSAVALEAVKRGAQDYLVKDPKRYGDVLGRILLYAIERKRAEKVVQHSLKLEQNTLREVLDEAPLHIIRIDSDLRIKDVNPMVVKAAGIHEDNLLGQDILSIFPDFDREKLEELVKAGLTYHNQQLKVSRLGRSYFNNYYLDVVGWPTQRTLTDEKEAIIICTDVSERVRLANQRDEFIAALAHDIRNPLIGELRVLNGIISGALGEICAPVKSALESLMKSNNSLLLMMTNMLEVYELEASGTTLHLERMELSDLVEEVVSEMNYLTIGSQMKLEFNSLCQSSTIEGDETALKRVVQNLSYNAVKYADSDSTISISVCDDDSDQVLMRVHNQGPKIKDEEKMHLFDRFTKATLGRRYMHSSGLGLYLCKKIIEGHGGIIGCTSDDNGTTFLVSIPRAGDDSAVDD
ncbi:MAG: response regulator [Candidatus Obscuribacterales bacterium]|nr:response regulator [Candidatus Obscuribacterales bacterium]